MTEYANKIEEFLDDSQRQMVYYQQSKYNYDIIDREKEKTVAWNRNLQIWLMWCLIIVCALSAIVFYLKNKNKLQIIELQQSLANISRLEDEIKAKKSFTNSNNPEELMSECNSCDYKRRIDIKVPQNADKEYLKKLLLIKLNSLPSNVESISDVEPSILQSKIYKSLQDKIHKGEGLSDKSDLWNELEQTILKAYPEFRQRLYLLSGGRIRSDIYHTAMLVKCGISATEISVLMNKSKSSISYKRKTLGKMCFGEEVNPVLVDNIIKCL